MKSCRTLHFAVLKIEITQALAGLQNGHAIEPLTRARELADRTVRTVRDISLLSRPSLDLDHLGLGPALQWQTQDFTRRTGVPCEYVEVVAESLPDPVNTCVSSCYTGGSSKLREALAGNQRIRPGEPNGDRHDC